MDPKSVEDFKKRFSIPAGFDHPNEVAAHLSRVILLNDYLETDIAESERSQKFSKATRVAFRQIFAIRNK